VIYELHKLTQDLRNDLPNFYFRDINKALMFAQAVQAGSVWVNCYDAVASQTPFGGFKQSGDLKDLTMWTIA